MERNLRAKARDQNAAAVCIQRMWRGHSQREKAGKDRFSAWMQAFGGVAADPDTLLSAIQIYGEMWIATLVEDTGLSHLVTWIMWFVNVLTVMSR